MSKILFTVILAFFSNSVFGVEQVCTGLVTLLPPIEAKRDGFITANFLMHKETFICTGDEKQSNITGYRHEALDYVEDKNNPFQPNTGQMLRVTYRLSEGVTLGGGGFLNWSIEAFNDLKVNKKQLQAINKTLKSIKTHTYFGGYFSIKYPKNFTVRTGEPISKNSREEYKPQDEAYFTFPDGDVEFFLYSPAWGGKPRSYLEVADNEILVDEQSSKGSNKGPYESKELNQLLTRRVTVKSKDGSYFRSFIQMRKRSSDFSLNISSIDLVFGIKYKNKQAYDKYRNDYIAFKKSLKQSAD